MTQHNSYDFYIDKTADHQAAKVHFKPLCTNKVPLIEFPDRHDRLSDTSCPARLKLLSLGALVGMTHRTVLARWANTGNSWLCCFHQSRILSHVPGATLWFWYLCTSERSEIGMPSNSSTATLRRLGVEGYLVAHQRCGLGDAEVVLPFCCSHI